MNLLNPGVNGSNATNSPLNFPPVDSQRGQQVLKKIPEFPATVRNFFGAQNIQKIIDILTSNEVVEVDTLFMSCQLTGPEYVQYLALLPEQELVAERLRLAVTECVESLRPRFSEIAKATVKGEKKGSLIFAHNQICKLLSSFLVPVPCPYRILLMNRLRDDLLVHFFREISKTFEELPSNKDRAVFVNTRKELYKYWLKATGNVYPPSHFFSSLRNIKLCQSHLRFAGNLQKAFPPLECSDGEKAQLDQEMHDQFAEIKELSQYRKVLFTPWESGETKVSILGDEATRIPGSGPGICAVEIVLNPFEDLQIPKHRVDKTHREHMVFKTGDGIIHLTVNRRNGELCFFGQREVCIDGMVPGPTYLAIKKRVYAMLLDYLRKKEPDIDDLFAQYVAPPEQEIMKETKSMVDDTVADGVVVSDPGGAPDSMEEAIELQTDFVEHWKPVYKPQSDVSDTQAGETIHEEIQEPEQRQKKYEFLRRLRGLKGQKALSALKRLLGEPLRVQGSHFLFKSDRNGKIFPFPVHMAADMNVAILSTNLMGLGYGLDEFCELL